MLLLFSQMMLCWGCLLFYDVSFLCMFYCGGTFNFVRHNCLRACFIVTECGRRRQTRQKHVEFGIYNINLNSSTVYLKMTYILGAKCYSKISTVRSRLYVVLVGGIKVL